MISLTNKQVSGVYNRKLGAAIVTTLLDGYLDIPKELFSGIKKEDEINLILDSSSPDTYKILMNGFLINQNGQLTLVDPGGSIYAEPTLGQLMENLKSIGVSPDQIDNVLLTHIHPDHSYGLLDENGEKAFKNAQLFVHEKDLEFWMDGRNASKVHPIFEITFELTKKAYLLYKDQCRTFSKEEEILPGIFTIESPGHTFGHTCFLFQSENEKLLIWGDMAHIPELEVPKPEIEFLMDLDPELALKSRKRIFDMASREQLLVAAMHADFPGFGYVKRNADSYLFVKEQWHSIL
ncbi:MAG: MBL fold metallo-hydrolase [Solibacillus sp.]